MTPAILLLAAGQSRRFGPTDKLLAPLGDTSIIQATMDALVLPSAWARVAVVSSSAVAAVVTQAGFHALHVPPGLPQSDSLLAGIAHLRACPPTHVLIALADMPFIHRDDITRLLDLAGSEDACMSMDGTPMPPAVLPAHLFDALAALTGDRGAGAFLRAIPAGRRLALPPERLRDIDTLSDLDREQSG